MAAPAPRQFVVLDVSQATAVVTSVPGKPSSTELPTSAFSSKKSSRTSALVVVGGLLYLAGVLGYVVTSGVAPAPLSQPSVWVVCLPYAALMTHKLIKTIRAMEAADDAADLDDECLEDGEEQVFGQHASHDAIAVVGDVCIYVVGILLLCYLALPWQLYIE